MRLLVTGASGLVGSRVVALAGSRHEVFALGRKELDVTAPPEIDRAFQEISPEAVLNCAAYTDVDGAEREPERALQVNARGPEELGRRARAAGAAMLHVSTDYVFDGSADAPYDERATPSPLSSYGRSKLEGERRLVDACPESSVIVRTGWLYGPGKGFVDWARARLEGGEELPLVEDQWGSPTSADELASALLLLVERELRGLFHYVNAGVASWLELGRAVARELDVDPDDARIRPIRARELDRPAPRPRYSALSVGRFQSVTGARAPTWREALHRYLSSPRPS